MAERYVDFIVRVKGDDSSGRVFGGIGKEATKAYDAAAKAKANASKSIQKLAEEDARFEQKVANDTYRLRMKLWADDKREQEKVSRDTLRTRQMIWRQEQQEAERAKREAAAVARQEQKEANDTFRLRQKLFADKRRAEEQAAREAEANAKKAEALQDQATKKYLSGAQQGVAAISSLTRAGVLLWAANEEEAEKVLKTLATFEAGAQFLQGTIDAVQTLVTMWEAADSAAKAYVLAEAAVGAAGAASGASRAVGGAAAGAAAGGATTAAIGAAGGAAATGGVWATLSGAFSAAVSAVGTGIAALTGPLAGIGVAFGAAAATTMSVAGDIVSYFTGLKNYWSLSGAIEGAGSLLGMRYSGAQGVERNEKELANNRTEYERRLSLHDLRAQESAAMREAERSMAFRGSSLASRQADFQANFSSSRNRLSDLQSRFASVEGGTPEAAAQRTSLTREIQAEAMRVRELQQQGLDLQREAGQKEVNRMQELIRLTEAATDVAKRARAEAEKATMSAAERFAAMSPAEQLRSERAAQKVLGGGALGRRDIQALSSFADEPMIKAAIQSASLKMFSSGGVGLQTLYNRSEDRASEAYERALADERSTAASARENKLFEVKTELGGKITVTLDDSSFAAAWSKFGKEQVLPALQKSTASGFADRSREIQQQRANQ